MIRQVVATGLLLIGCVQLAFLFGYRVGLAVLLITIASWIVLEEQS